MPAKRGPWKRVKAKRNLPVDKTGVFTFSPSLLSRLSGPCERQAVLDWLSGEETISPVMARGVAFHAAANTAIDWMEQRGEAPDIAAIVAPAFHRAWDNSPWVTNDQGNRESEAFVHELVTKLLDIWRPVGDAWPALVETPMTWEDRSRKIRVRARLDRIYRCLDGSAQVIDFKSGSALVAPIAVSAQRLAVGAHLPERPISFTYYHARPQIIRDYAPDETTLEAAIDRMAELAEHVKAGFAPHEPQPIPACNGCRFKVDCPLWNTPTLFSVSDESLPTTPNE